MSKKTAKSDISHGNRYPFDASRRIGPSPLREA